MISIFNSSARILDATRNSQDDLDRKQKMKTGNCVGGLPHDCSGASP